MSTKALESQVSISEYARVVYAHTPGDAVKYDEVLEPEYWANVATKFKPGSRIEVLAPDLTWFAELVVVSAGRSWAKVASLRHVKLVASKEVKEKDLTKDRKGYDVQFAGQNKMYRVIRKVDKTELKDGLPSEDEGWKWVDNHIKALSL